MAIFDDDYLRKLMGPSAHSQLRWLTEPTFQEQIRKFGEPSPGMLAVQEQIRKLTEQSSDVYALREQMRRYADPAASGLLALQDQMRKFAQASSPGLLALQEQMRSVTEQTSALLERQEHLRRQMEPSLVAFREGIGRFAETSSAISQHIREAAERSSSVLSIYSQQMRSVADLPSNLLAFQNQMQLVAEQSASFRMALSAAGLAGKFPLATVIEPLFADRMVALARANGELSELLGSSFTLDAVATADEFLEEPPAPAAFIDFLDRLGAVIRDYLAAARSIGDLANLYQMTMLMLTAATFWYAMYSATSKDIDQLRTIAEQQNEAVVRQTEVMREEFRASRQQFSDKLDELTKAIQQLAADKAATFGPAAVYRVDRATPVKAERKMKSQTIGWIQVGQAVFVVARDKKWVQIEYTDLATGTSETGWVVKKYLKRL